MEFKPIPFRSGLEEYQKQAEELLSGWQAGDVGAIQLARTKHPRFLDERIPWLPKNVPDPEIRGAGLGLSDAQLTIARAYDFRDWPALAEYAAAVTRDDSPEYRFESAVEAVINGDVATLKALLGAHPELVRARSMRITHFDPPVHRATLLHYLGANGVEGYREKTPPNAVEVAKILLEAGAAADALADMYGGQYATMSMLVSSSHPAKAGVQVVLIDTLVDFGAAVEPRGSAKWGSPLMTALAFGFMGAAEALVRRGAKIDNLAAAAGLGRLAEMCQLLPTADAEDRRRALALAAQGGHADIVALLLDAGEDPSRYNPDGNHAHSTPLHQAALAGHDGVVRLLVEWGTRLDVQDTIYQGTPLDWAIYGGQRDIEEYLRARGAKTTQELRP